MGAKRTKQIRDADNREVVVTACECGHVHVLIEMEDDETLHVALTSDQAADLARALIMSGYQADMAQANLPGGSPGGRAEKCSKLH